MRALGPGAALRASVGLFRQRPLTTLALGLALLTSLFSICCVAAAPWFLCELFALQIMLGSGQRPARTRAWLFAGLVQMLAVMILSTVVGLTLLSVGPDVVLGGASGADAARSLSGVLRSLSVWLVAGSVLLAMSVYFEHAPALLLDRGGSLSAALLESARIVAASGVYRTWLTSGVAHGLQLAPIVISVTALAAFGTLSSTLWLGLLALPVSACSVALGQGMLVASYLELRNEALDPSQVPPEAALSTSRALLWTVLLLCVIAGPVTMSGALIRPALAREFALPKDEAPLLVLEAHGRDVPEHYIPDTALTVRISRGKVRVQASDGGGAGRIPLPRDGIARVRVLRARQLPDDLRVDTFGISIFAIETRILDGRTFTTWINDAGIRVDDSLTRRLRSLLPSWAIAALALTLLWTALWVALAVPPQARLRKALSERLSAGEPLEACRSLDRALRGQVLKAALWLAPAAFGSLAIGLWAVLGEGNLAP
jgi:hypothetical protein